MDREVAARPDRLNLSIGISCYVRCPGCYNVFGRRPPDLDGFEASAAAFARCGIRAVTISGGDPGRIAGLVGFLGRLRRLGMTSIKVDTVGTGLLTAGRRSGAAALCEAVDILGLPLDGWDEHSVSLFRQGRPRLFAETVELLEALDAARPPCEVYVNTVAHAGNLHGLSRVFDVVNRFACVRRWNVFQYTPTDHAANEVNRSLSVDNVTFARTGHAFRSGVPRVCEIEWASNHDRLGRYLLVNSDGDAWMPDAHGASIGLGRVFGREPDVLTAWRRAASSLAAAPCAPVS